MDWELIQFYTCTGSLRGKAWLPHRRAAVSKLISKSVRRSRQHSKETKDRRQQHRREKTYAKKRKKP